MLHQAGNRLLVRVLWSVAGVTLRFFFSYATHLLIVPDADSLSCYCLIIVLHSCPLILAVFVVSIIWLWDSPSLFTSSQQLLVFFHLFLFSGCWFLRSNSDWLFTIDVRLWQWWPLKMAWTKSKWVFFCVLMELNASSSEIKSELRVRTVTNGPTNQLHTHQNKLVKKRADIVW